MTEEDRQRTMDFILEQQAQFSVNMEAMRETQAQFSTNLEALREAQARTDAIVGHLTGQVQGIAGQLQNMARQQEHINEVVAVIAESQQHTDERLNALIDIVQAGRNGNP
jgi:acetolactate synthase small subunit